jgi:hypothetical protein
MICVALVMQALKAFNQTKMEEMERKQLLQTKVRCVLLCLFHFFFSVHLEFDLFPRA